MWPVGWLQGLVAGIVPFQLTMFVHLCCPLNEARFMNYDSQPSQAYTFEGDTGSVWRLKRSFFKATSAVDPCCHRSVRQEWLLLMEEARKKFGGVWKPNELGFVFGWKYSFWRTKLYIFIILQVPWLCQQWLKWRSKKSSHDWVTGWRIFQKNEDVAWKMNTRVDTLVDIGYIGGLR